MRAAAAILTAWLLLGATAAAADPAQDVSTKISSEIMSPFCPGVTLENCPSEAGQALRDRIAGWARQGWSEPRIMDHLVAQYGPSIRAVPADRGIGLFAWLLPGLAVLAGVGLAWVLARRWAARRAPAASVPEASAQDRGRIEAELARMRRRA